MHWKTTLPALVCVCTLFGGRTVCAQQNLVFEVENYTTPADAWVKDKDLPDKWNLWSTDKDAAKKWSQGVLFRSPTVAKDRATPEEGAPVLHTRLTGVPNGVYHVEVTPGGRTLGVSLDGVNWKPFKGGLVAREVIVGDGTFDLWVDDRYGYPDPASPGPCYYDTIRLYPKVPGVNGVANPDFELAGQDGTPTGWAWWSRSSVGKAESITADVHGGQRAAHVVHDGDADWALTSSERLAVKPGEEFSINAWMKNPGSAVVEATVVGVGEDGRVVHWQLGRARCGAATPNWKAAKGYLQVPDDVREVYVRIVGKGKTDAYVDDIELKHDTVVVPDMPKVSGSARTRVEEKLDRGVVALRTAQGIYVGWRRLKSDPPDIAFDVFRRVGDGEPVKVNTGPIRWTTDLLDREAPADAAPVYIVRPAGAARGGLRGVLSRVFGGSRDESSAPTAVCEGTTPYVSFKLDGNYKFQKIGIADLDGDGRYDYVIKQPHDNVDPCEAYWYKSPETYKLEAYTHDGTFLWRIDLGWSIERGIWYSPYIVYDLDGDGKAEVAAKVGEGDPRDADGRVTSGPEWVVVYDGLTGKERARAPWPARDGFENYNLASRNQLSIAYLDGKTPCLIVMRGTYGLMKAEAYEFTGKRLRPLWAYNNEPYGRRYWGQGAHFTHAVDVDGDGRDEVALGSAVLDDTGAPLWSTGMGHPDHSYWGDLDPHRPGMEVYYGVETRAKKNGTLMCDVATGKMLWGLDEPTTHVHGTGLCGDVDPTQPGVESYGADSEGDHQKTDRRWMHNAAGELIKCPEDFSFGPQSVYWDADLQREVLSGGIRDYGGGKHADRTQGSIVLIADVLGDWREEIITSVPGELRIYSTTLPATDRRACFMQDPIYRLDVAMTAMGYTPVPTTSYSLEATAPGLNLTAVTDANGAPACRVVVSAPLDRAVAGTLELTCDGGVLEPASFAVNVAPGERFVGQARFNPSGDARICATVRAELRGYERPLRGQVDIKAPSKPLTGVPMVQAEKFTGQGGGEVKIRDDKPGVIEKAISHWDAKGHWLEWRFEETPGKYQVVARYSAASTAKRAVAFDGQDRGLLQFPGTGGFGDTADTWDHTTLKADGKPLVLDLTAGEHVLRLENTDGNGLNLDYLALVPVK